MARPKKSCVCNICGFVAKKPVGLAAHMRSHQNGRLNEGDGSMGKAVRVYEDAKANLKKEMQAEFGMGA